MGEAERQAAAAEKEQLEQQRQLAASAEAERQAAAVEKEQQEQQRKNAKNCTVDAVPATQPTSGKSIESDAQDSVINAIRSAGTAQVFQQYAENAIVDGLNSLEVLQEYYDADATLGEFMADLQVTKRPHCRAIVVK